jgi:hypothetical protein
MYATEIEISLDRLERRSGIPGYIKSYCEGGSINAVKADFEPGTDFVLQEDRNLHNCVFCKKNCSYGIEGCMRNNLCLDKE